MKDIEFLINQLSSSSKHEVMWLGAVDEEQIDILENKLSLKLPEDFKFFLMKTGGGGVVEQEISGIEDNNALAEFGGTVYYDTTYCRNEYDLPDNLAVIYFRDDEICWCLELSSNDSVKVISYDIFSRKKQNIMHNSFKDFFEEYVKLRC